MRGAEESSPRGRGGLVSGGRAELGSRPEERGEGGRVSGWGGGYKIECIHIYIHTHVQG
jgi:hypothetical protein